MFVKFAELIRFSRYKEWHFGNIPLLFNVIFIICLRSSECLNIFMALQWYIIFASFLAFAYMINNVSDIEIDSKVGKVIELKSLSFKVRFLITMITGVFGLAFASLYLDIYALGILLGCYLMAWTYSLPPRFKEHNWIGPIVASIGQLSIPTIVILVSYRCFSLSAICYVFLTFLWGLRMLLVHQILDMKNDKAAGVKTTVLSLGVESSYKLVFYMFSGELVLVLIQIILLVRDGLFPFTLTLLIIPLIHLMLRWKFKLPIRLDSYEYIPLADIYELILPLILSLSLFIVSHGEKWWTLLLIFVLFGSRYWERLTSAYFSIIDTKNDEGR